MSTRDKELVIHSIVDLLNLHQILDAPIGSASVGLADEQRKLACIGVQMCANPSVLLLDEPLRGLNSCAARMVVAAMRCVNAWHVCM
jgi:ABC-type multidrug transport system ATPase subunit